MAGLRHHSWGRHTEAGQELTAEGGGLVILARDYGNAPILVPDLYAQTVDELTRCLDCRFIVRAIDHFRSTSNVPGIVSPVEPIERHDRLLRGERRRLGKILSVRFRTLGEPDGRLPQSPGPAPIRKVGRMPQMRNFSNVSRLIDATIL